MPSLADLRRFVPRGCGFRGCSSKCDTSIVRMLTEATVCHVSSHGRVKQPGGLVHYGSSEGTGYRIVKIGGKNYSVHRLVASTYLGPPPTPERWQVNHIDCNRSNNHISNLQWSTAAENQLHSWRTNPQRRHGAALISKAVLWRPSGAESYTWTSSIKEAALASGLSQTSVSKCCHGLRDRVSRHEFRWAHSPGNHDALHGEVWKDCRCPPDDVPMPGVMVSSFGRIRFATRSHCHTTFGSCGHLNDYLRVKVGGRQFLVHRLVAMTFIGQPPSPEMQVNHKDGNRRNNSFDNLEYVSRSENQLHRYSFGRKGAVQRGKPVEARRLGSPATWQCLPSIKVAALHTGMTTYRVSKICKAQTVDNASNWELRFAVEVSPILHDEEWRPAVLEGARVQRAPPQSLH